MPKDKDKPEEQSQQSAGFSYLRPGANREQVEMMTKGSLSQLSATPAATAPPASKDYPADGTIPDVKDWIGDDLDRAQTAYDLEQDRPTGPRSTLLDYLDSLLSDD